MEKRTGPSTPHRSTEGLNEIIKNSVRIVKERLQVSSFFSINNLLGVDCSIQDLER